jgi:hypothetical protein
MPRPPQLMKPKLISPFGFAARRERAGSEVITPAATPAIEFWHFVSIVLRGKVGLMSIILIDFASCVGVPEP